VGTGRRPSGGGADAPAGAWKRCQGGGRGTGVVMWRSGAKALTRPSGVEADAVARGGWGDVGTAGRRWRRGADAEAPAQQSGVEARRRGAEEPAWRSGCEGADTRVSRVSAG
jgi:hypothetical protein